MILRVCFALAVAGLTLGQNCLPGSSPKPEPQSLPRVKLITSKGKIVIELFTPHTSAAVRFKELVETGYYDNTIFHEVRGGKWVVAGQYNADLERNEARTLVNDSANGLRNLAGRVSIYGPTDELLEGVPQFLINLADNSELDYTPSAGQEMDYTVIGRIVNATGLSTANAIGNLATQTTSTADGTVLNHVPSQDVVITSATIGDGPDADAGEDRIAVPGLLVALGALGDDAEAEAEGLSFSWTQIGGVNVSLADSDTAHPSFTVPQNADTLSFQVTVTDPDDRTDSDTVTITVDQGFTTTDSGLQYKDLVAGTGDLVTADATIRCLYTGKLAASWSVFDSTANRNNEPAEFSLGGLIEGWKEGLANYDMRAGGKRLLFIPPELGYGAAGSPPRIPGNAVLYFEVEILEIVE